MKIVVLNWFPPAKISWPSPALSVLSSTLRENGFSCKVIYWNIILEDLLSGYLFEHTTSAISEDEVLSLFFAYIALRDSDEGMLLKQESILKRRKPQYLICNFDFISHITKYCSLLEQRITEVITSIGNEVLYWGMSLHLYQWVAASTIAQIAKSLYPNIPIAVGGIGTPKMAEAFLKNFRQFDYAMWGEGEDSILKLTDMLAKDGEISQVPHLVYRDASGILNRGHGVKCFYKALSDIHFDFSDFFTAFKGQTEEIVLPIESSRGCHWSRCKFCFLNDGYRYRTKSPKEVDSELRLQITKYQVYKFSFLDNDLIGKSMPDFQELIGYLLKIKEEYPSFSIELAEIITQGINRFIIRDMSLAGLHHVQIGYESSSDNLLNKINKKNTFASNLLFIKWANFYHISLGGLNIIRGLLEENEVDIAEATDNLIYLRFFLDQTFCKHSITSLAIASSSQYYKNILEMKPCENIFIDRIKENLPSNYIQKENWFDIYQLISLRQNPMWNTFYEVENFLLQAQMSYRLIQGADSILYQELIGHEVAQAILFNPDDLEWRILEAANNEVITIEHLQATLKASIKDIEVAIASLKSVKLVFYSNIHHELVSVINTDIRS